MDFASIMKSRMGKNKSREPTTTSSSADIAKPAAPKFVRRSELEAQRVATYRREEEAAQAARLERDLKRQRDEEDERERTAARAAKKARLAEQSRLQREADERADEDARRKRLGLPPLPDKTAADADADDGASSEEEDDEEEGGHGANNVPDNLPAAELRARLRALHEPVTLFGEQHATRLRRLRRLLSSAKVAAAASGRSGGPVPTTLALVPEAELPLVPAKPPPRRRDPAARAALFRHLASYFALVFTEWQIALAARPADVKASSSGRQALTAFEAARSSMPPLFRAFEKAHANARRAVRRQRKEQEAAAAAAITDGKEADGKNTDEQQKRRQQQQQQQQQQSGKGRPGGGKGKDKNKGDGDDGDDDDAIPNAVLEGIVEIVHAAQRRRYVQASDAYLRLSIGKAAWPIGVTMVGIHERSAREKLHEHDGDRKAHIMSDESTRKYLQAIKSCLGFAQTRWPPEDHLQLMG